MPHIIYIKDLHMSINPLLLPVKKDADTIRKTVLTNIVKMYNGRKWINDKNLDKEIKQIIETQNDNHIYKINLDVDLKTFETYYPVEVGEERKFDKDFVGTVVMVKLLPQKVTSISKSPIIQEFFNDYKKFHRILIVDMISDKSKNQITTEKNVEVFTEPFFMMNLLDHVCSPKYEVLNPAETIEFLESYHLTRKQMEKIHDNEPAAYYLFLKKKQIVRIIRNSEQTAKAVDYKLVIHRG